MAIRIPIITDLQDKGIRDAKKAFGDLVAFVYGWTVFLVIQTGVIAAVAVAFAKFSNRCRKSSAITLA